MEITKHHVANFFYMLLVVLVVGCVIFYFLSNAATSVPVWLIGGIVCTIFYLVGYLVRWMTKKKAT